jgi:hypothetical protein
MTTKRLYYFEMTISQKIDFLNEFLNWLNSVCIEKPIRFTIDYINLLDLPKIEALIFPRGTARSHPQYSQCPYEFADVINISIQIKGDQIEAIHTLSFYSRLMESPKYYALYTLKVHKKLIKAITKEIASLRLAIIRDNRS